MRRIALLLTAMVAGPLSAQGPRLGIAPEAGRLSVAVEADVETPIAHAFQGKRRDARYTGLAIGAFLVGTGAALYAGAACNVLAYDPEGSCTPETLLGLGAGAVAGGAVGYLVGLTFRSREKQAAP